MARRDEKKIAAAQAKWREQDLRTFGKLDDASMADRHDALLDLLAAHVPIDDAEETTMSDEIDTSAPERIWAVFEPHESGRGYPVVYAAATRTNGQEYIRADLHDALRQRAEKMEAALAAFAEPGHWFDVEDAIDEQMYRAWRGPVAEPEEFARAALRNEGDDDA